MKWYERRIWGLRDPSEFRPGAIDLQTPEVLETSGVLVIHTKKPYPLPETGLDYRIRFSITTVCAMWINSSTAFAPKSSFVRSRTATVPCSASLSPTTSM